jgi:hypothetical protein
LIPVEIYPIQDAMVLRARGSELLILADHVAALKNLKSAGDFAKYFLDEALVNRPARKLFEAWLRKDGSLWARIYKTVQTIESGAHAEAGKSESTPDPVKQAAKETAKETAKEAKKPAEAKTKSEKPSAKKEEKKEEKKPAAKAAAKPAKPAAKKATPKPTAKPAAKSAAKSVTKAAPKPAAKTAAKKSGKK